MQLIFDRTVSAEPSAGL